MPPFVGRKRMANFWMNKINNLVNLIWAILPISMLEWEGIANTHYEQFPNKQRHHMALAV